MASLMDSIMNQYREKNAMRVLPPNAPYGGLGGAAESMAGNTSIPRPMMMGAPSPMFPQVQLQRPMMVNTEPGYSGATGAMVPTAAEAARPALPGRTPGFLDQLLSGPNYQSNNMPVNVQAAGPAMQGQQMPNVAINWGDAQNPADFFRADQMLQQNAQIPGFLGGF